MTDRMYELEQAYLYAGGCQLDPEESESIICDCGHECEDGDEHKVNGETKCPKCYARYLTKLHEKYLEVMKTKFTEEELDIMYEEGMLEDFTDGVFYRTVSF